MFEIHEDKKGEYRWRLKSGNGEIVAVGEGYTLKDALVAVGEGYIRLKDAQRSIETVKKLAQES